MTEIFSVRLVGGKDDERAIFEFDADKDSCLLTCRYRDKAISFESTDYFEALALIRRQLEPEGLIPYCYGASLNVFPSGMARDMGQGLRAYRLTLGKHTKIADLVDIFDEGADVAPVDVDAQEQFYRNWLETPRA